ncbi:MAG: hypothetical protein ABSG60_08605 [Terracidiphilus sp.]|jgi:hypothetical protein
MATLRTHINLPEELAKDIDELVGPRGRSAFIVETTAKEVKRRRLLAFLDRDEPAWRDEDHPEIAAQGAAAWVHNLRRERSARQEHLDELAQETED